MFAKPLTGIDRLIARVNRAAIRVPDEPDGMSFRWAQNAVRTAYFSS
jgi:hypothetical protein